MKKEAGHHHHQPSFMKPLRTCRVLYNYVPDHKDELALAVNDIIEYSGEVEDGWWKGTLNGKTGVFPSNFVEVLPQEVEEQQVADKNKRNKEFHNLTPPGGLSELRASKPTIDMEPRIPKLPPKPVKEQCIVQYPYQAQNDDELTLVEGQILNIISKDSEDKGWWRGELDGKIGVFPDNFVKMVKVVNHQEINSGRQKLRALSPNRDSGSFEKGSREKLSSRSQSQHLHHSQQQNHIEAPKSPNKKGSFGKSNPPPKPKAPCPTKLISSNKPVSSAVNIGQPSRGSFLAAFKPSLSKNSSNRSSFSSSSVGYKSTGIGIMSSSPDQHSGDSQSSNSLSKSLPNNVEESLDQSPCLRSAENVDSREDFDGVSRSEKLAHPTADRVKGPKRRPPSSIFTKDMIALEDQNDDNNDDDQNSDTMNSCGMAVERNNSCSSVRDVKDVIVGDEDPDSEPIQRINKDGGGDDDDDEEDSSFPHNASLSNSSSPVNAFKEELQSRLENHSESAEGSCVKKPDWLEELSRKQANKKSGIFTDKVPVSRPSAPIVSDKPQLPTKPSQIRDDLRKLNKRVSNAENSGGSDKENSRPNRPSSLIDPGLISDHSNSSLVPAEAKNPWLSEEPATKGISKKQHSYSSDSKSKSQGNSEGGNSSLEERVSKLENTLVMYSERLQALEDSLQEEREMRLKLQQELEELKK